MFKPLLQSAELYLVFSERNTRNRGNGDYGTKSPSPSPVLHHPCNCRCVALYAPTLQSGLGDLSIMILDTSALTSSSGTTPALVAESQASQA